MMMDYARPGVILSLVEAHYKKIGNYTMRQKFIVLVLGFFLFAPMWGPGVPVGARWCAVHNPGLGNIQWDCHFRKLAWCAAAVGPASDFCLENPNWYIQRHKWR
jgi:hypothetical protein